MLWRLHWFLLLWCFATSDVSVANADDAIENVIAATFKITNKNSTATCFVISRSATSDTRQQELILVTAAHVFERMSGNECHVVLRTHLADGSFVRNEVPLKIRSAKQPLWFRHPEVDVAALKLELPADQTIKALDFDQLAGESTIGNPKLRTAKEVWIPCYPAQLEANSAGFPILRRGTVASFPLTPINRYTTFLLDCRTFAGDSGAAVLVHNGKDSEKAPQRPLVVGLVIGQHRETTKSITPIEERTVHRPLGLAIVVHAVFIRQTVARIPQ